MSWATKVRDWVTRRALKPPKALRDLQLKDALELLDDAGQAAVRAIADRFVQYIETVANAAVQDTREQAKTALIRVLAGQPVIWRVEGFRLETRLTLLRTALVDEFRRTLPPAGDAVWAALLRKAEHALRDILTEEKIQ